MSPLSEEIQARPCTHWAHAEDWGQWSLRMSFSSKHIFCVPISFMPRPPCSFGLQTCSHATRQLASEALPVWYVISLDDVFITLLAAGKERPLVNRRSSNLKIKQVTVPKTKWKTSKLQYVIYFMNSIRNRKCQCHSPVNRVAHCGTCRT